MRLILSIKTADFYQGISNDVQKQFDPSNYDGRRRKTPLKKKVIGLMKDVRRIIKLQNFQKLIQKNMVVDSKRLIMKWKTLTL